MTSSMAALTRRHFLSLSNLHRSPPPYLFLRRFFSDENPRIPPQPVSYAVKPKPTPPEPSVKPEPPPPEPSAAAETAEQPLRQREFTREELRYMKDSPQITPVSYGVKVAPLPEDRTASLPEDTVAPTVTEGGGQLERESRMIRRVFRPTVRVEEVIEVPFPKLIKVDKTSKEKVVVDLQDAIRCVKANAKRNFDETLEAHVNMGVDRRRSDLGVSGAVVLPHGTGKSVKVAVFAEGSAADEARAAGADVVGGDELIEEIKTSGKINFDRCIATHSMMQRVTKIGRILRGLTPNAKKGTVTNNVSGAVQEAKQGLLDFRMKDAIVHVGLGKVSFTEEALQENVGAFVNALLLAKPPGLKKTSKYAGYVNSFHLCSTMGPGYTVSIQSLSRAADSYAKMHPK
ncbi:uncharacterized protein LOC141604683 [Silene latifolia]|uniref:uncharacterized protein LOC141604683 n=1 Tax=Silene latifolia TaxID=37657 RepID=UPI003D781435